MNVSSEASAYKCRVKSFGASASNGTTRRHHHGTKTQASHLHAIPQQYRHRHRPDLFSTSTISRTPDLGTLLEKKNLFTLEKNLPYTTLKKPFCVHSKKPFLVPHSKPPEFYSRLLGWLGVCVCVRVWLVAWLLGRSVGRLCGCLLGWARRDWLRGGVCNCTPTSGFVQLLKINKSACAQQFQRTKKLTAATLRFANNVHLTKRFNHGPNS